MTRQWYRSRRVRLCAVACLCAAVIAPATATTVVPMTDDDMVRHAAHIVEGVVKKVESKWNADKTQIHTFIDIGVTNQIKGKLPKAQSEIHLRVLGGTVDDITMAIVAAPTFAVKEEVLLFLRPNHEHWLFPIVGFNQGKLRIDTHPKTGKKLILERKVTRDAYVAGLAKTVAQQSPKPKVNPTATKREG